MRKTRMAKQAKIYIPRYIKLHPKIQRIVEDTASEFLVETAKKGYPQMLLDDTSPFLTPEAIEVQWEYLSGEILDEPGDISFQNAKADLYHSRGAIKFYIQTHWNAIQERAYSSIEKNLDPDDPEDYLLSLKLSSAAVTPARRGRPVTRSDEERFPSTRGGPRGRPPGTGHLQRGVERPSTSPKIGRKPGYQWTDEQKDEASRRATEAMEGLRGVGPRPETKPEEVEPDYDEIFKDIF